MSRHPIDLAIPVSAVDHALGPAHSPVTVVEYGDFECPTCKQAAPAVKVMLERFGNHVRFVFRHFPVEAAHPHAMHAAQAAEAAGGQGKFWQMHDLLFENQRHLKVANLREYAQRLELEMPRFIAELDDEIYLQRVREHIQGGVRSHVRGTPTFYINGVIQDVSFGMHALIDGVQAEMRRVER
ncbi:MAG TPA: DsbA family protein [Steroidobacteraceae bacterium]|jgi:protein-disulfide isomerase|nr:DsbA family protein [Steroidobacteraceae bacterium]